MAGTDWLADRRGEVAAERILDAAGELFTEHDPGAVGMLEIARAAGCSRATLYRYFENRDALYTAYVHREARALYHQMTARLADVTDPQQRLLTGIVQALALVRQNPALASWFATTGPPIGAEMADRSAVITAMVGGFVASLEPDGDQAPADVERRARWVVRVMTSLLNFPGRDAADEQAMLQEFVLPVVVPAARPRHATQ
ncbi:TetR/AcrR family transcriptional regulator [Mycobacterium talmoniae]|uniref:TetR family transcriptional regulator n=2 Tax=Mycobacterium talmoniae TaxID=1858794 RepID=A0A1S1NMB7_9MYCO|nr:MULTISPECIES: TetR/AcrR family transcriptional regulator [Mycobacterium]OHV04371.1 TetR family transcriptional regulator [Mycobacterium talmoniae]TDH51724.1 TetR/AcrR family transcriptional regulator [Mycobacterium eburneum]